MKEPARTLVEAVFVAAATLGAGLLANAASPDGLALTRDYFRTAAPTAPLSQPVAAAPVPAAPPQAPAAPDEAHGAPVVAEPTSAEDPATAAVIERLRARGLQPLTHAEALAVFEDPAREAGLYVFVDARGDDDFRAGHIPGALQFDRYHPERHLDAVLAACAGALKVVVYCIGKDCEDSELAALDLAGFGIPPHVLHVYAGGWSEWTAAGLPAETGATGGGDG